jgi:hypothetical protein
MIALLLSTLLSAQDPAPTPKPAETPTPAPARSALAQAWDDATAKEALAEANKLLKGAGMAQKSRALDMLAGGSHKLLVKPLAQVVEGEKLLVVRKRAAELLGNQPATDANATIRRLLKNGKLGAYPPVMAELVRGLGRCGYDQKQWAEIAELFEREYNVERVPIQEALLELITAHKEKQALPLLLRNLDEPVPVDVEARSNPPAEYWEARWKSWAVWKGKVKDALFAITGQRFSTAAEAKAWLEKNPVK